MAETDLLLIIKFTVTPILVGLASLAARRWGNRVAGLIIGFPLMTGPISIFLTIEQGAQFTVSSSIGILVALVGVAAFTLTYTIVARFSSWPISIGLAATMFIVTSALAAPHLTTHGSAALAAYGAILVAVTLMPRHEAAQDKLKVPGWEIWFRMLATGLMIALVTSIAQLVGPKWAGIIATVPVMVTIMVIFTHGRFGHQTAAVLLRSMTLSLLSFATFFVVLAYALQSMNPVLSYTLATIAAVGLNPIINKVDKAIAS